LYYKSSAELRCEWRGQRYVDCRVEQGMSTGWALWNDLDCRALRKRLGLSQRQFAHRFNFPVSTLRQWEQGKRRPSGAALALLHVIAYQPAVATRAVIRARTASADRVCP
jgi:putative transcriptional regulator